MLDTLEVVSATLGAILLAVLIQWRFDPLYSIPTVGPSWPLLSYLGAYRYLHNARDMLQEGYEKYKVFKVAMLDQWLVIVSGADMHEELRKYPDSIMTFQDAAEEFVQIRYSMATDITEHPIHIQAIRGPLTKNLGVLFNDLADENNAAFDDCINKRLQDNEWTSVDAMMTMAVIISRVSNRVFVGLPLCRNSDYLAIVRQFTFDVSRALYYLSLVPKAFKGIVGPFIPWARTATRSASVYLRPMIEERRRKLKELGKNWTDKPNDYLMWIMDEANRQGMSTDLIIQAVMVSNFAAIHTSSMSITQAIYQLAAHPESMRPLREEAESVIKECGWTKVSMGRMRKLDSFMRESQRFNGITHIAVMRKTLQPVTLSDGTYLPPGTLVTGTTTPTHFDERYYDNPNVFDPFRFSGMREEEGENIKHQFVSTSPNYVPFGHGKHACPGRFFAANELKMMMVYIVLNYDIKFDGLGTRPPNRSSWHSIVPQQAKVLFRKRQVVAA